ncbi:MAG: DUF2490 domain-containing protein [Chitinophagales bacterium]|nr:DUF2490 domain-containing protein [Chitinophagales bacterium]
MLTSSVHTALRCSPRQKSDLFRNSGAAACCLLAVLLFSCPESIQAQAAYSPQNDFRGIVGLNIEKKISRSFSLTLFNQAIFNQNLAELGTCLIDAGINYKLNRNFTLGLDYRFVLSRNLNNAYDNRQLLMADIAYTKGFHNFSLTARVRFSSQYYDQLTAENYRPAAFYNRDKLTLRYRISYFLSPYVSGEIFYPLNNAERNGIDRFRGSAGFFYNFNDHLRSEWYYTISPGFNRKTNNTVYAAGSTWYYRF